MNPNTSENDKSVSNDEQNRLYIKDLAFDPVAEPLPFETQLQVQQENGYAIVQYEVGSGPSVHRAIQKAGGRIYGPIVHNGLLVGGLSLGDLTAIKGVRFAGVMHPGYKLNANLRAIAISGMAEVRIDLIVTVFENAAATVLDIGKLGGLARIFQTADGQEVLVIQVPANQLIALTTLGEVRHVEPTAMPKLDLDVAPVFIGARANAQPPWQNVDNLTGKDQVLGVYDSGVDTGNTDTLVLDLVGRVDGDLEGWTNDMLEPTWAGIFYDGQPQPHGTFVTDIAIGNGDSSDGNLKGVAFEATAIMRPLVADSDGLTPRFLNIARALVNAFAGGAFIHNNSWSPATGTFPNLTSIIDEYSGQGSATIDTFVVANPEMLVITSAGNEGTRKPSATMSTLSCSKNSLAVGNSGNGSPPTGNNGVPGLPPNSIAPNSSRGPCPGGRLKPDVVAPGTLVAARCMAPACPAQNPPYVGEAQYTYSAGTSMSAPLVAGAALLLREEMTADRNRPNATGMLLKALLINGAAQLFDYAPDNSQGWGRISVNQSLGAGNIQFVHFYDSLSESGATFEFTQTGQSVVFENVFFVPNLPLAITLTWYDLPDGGLAGMLVNDLDLTLTLPDGTVYRGGVPSMDGGVTVANGPADVNNNTEKLILGLTPAGACTIEVTASNIAPGQRQAFALVVSPVDHQDVQAGSPLTRLRH